MRGVRLLILTHLSGAHEYRAQNAICGVWWCVAIRRDIYAWRRHVVKLCFMNVMKYIEPPPCFLGLSDAQVTGLLPATALFTPTPKCHMVSLLFLYFHQNEISWSWWMTEGIPINSRSAHLKCISNAVRTVTGWRANECANGLNFKQRLWKSSHLSRYKESCRRNIDITNFSLYSYSWLYLFSYIFLYLAISLPCSPLPFF